MTFRSHYFEKTINIAIRFDCCYINENDELEFEIPMSDIPYLVDEGALILSHKGKIFKTYNEAVEAYDKDPIIEATGGKYVDKTTTFKDPETGEERSFEVAKGNIKIGGNTVILNMSTATGCMSAIIGLCKLAADGYCYALRSEQRFGDEPKGPKAKNIRHEKQWACLTPAGIAKGLDNITKRLKSIEYIRVNESGEFRNLPADADMLANVPQAIQDKIGTVDDVKKLQQVGEELKRLGSDLKLYTYTHRTDLIIGNLGDNICVNGSQFMLDNAFIAVPYEEFIDIMTKTNNNTIKGTNMFGSTVVNPRHCMGDCRKCNHCKKKSGQHIFLPIHGSATKFNNRVDEIIGNVTNSPEFNNIINSDKNNAEKGEALLNIVDSKDAKELTLLIPIRQDRIDMFTKLVSGKLTLDTFIKDIEALASEYRENPEKAAMEGIAKSMDSLSGKFAANIEQAISLGKKASQTKWTKLNAALQKIHNAAKTGNIVKPTGTLAKRWSSFKRNQSDEI